MEEYKVKVYRDRTQWYNKEGQLHRLDGPAIERSDGSKLWYKDGKYHRLDGPAIELVNGTKFWYKNGQMHRLDGPAIEYSDGEQLWFIEDRHLSEEEFNKRTDPAPCEGREVEIDGVTYVLKAK